MRRELQSSTATVEDIKTIVPINKGGTNVNSKLAAITSLGGIAASKLGAADGFLALGSDGKIQAAQLPVGASSSDSVSGSINLFVNQVSTYTLTNFDSYRAYTLTAVSGSVSRSGATITYTAPATAGAGGFILNGKTFNVTIVAIVPNAPTITSPVNNATNVAKTPTITSGAFSMTTGTDTHASTDWQIATDSSFNTVVVSSINDTVNKVSWSPVLPTAGITYYIRARYKGTTYGYGAYSTTVSFTAIAAFIPSSEEAKITASDKQGSDYFGWSVSISSDGSRVVIGAYNEYPGGITAAGSAYIFSRSGTTWTQEAKISASDAQNSDHFGQSVSISGDGSRVVIGAYQQDVSSIGDAGSAYIFSRTGTTWTQEAKLNSSILISSAWFGQSVSMSSDGSRVIIGAWYETVNSISGVGSAYVFSRLGTVWTQEAKLNATDKEFDDQFGTSVSISGDGSRVVIGAQREDPSSISNAGSAYIFSRSGTTWTQEAKLMASDKATGDSFGWSVAMSSDGTRVVIGAYADDHTVIDGGSAYIFYRTGTTWTQEAKLVASDSAQSDQCGFSVAISNDGSRVVIGAGYDNSATGSAYIFSRSGTTWTQEAKLMASDKEAFDYFGSSVAMSGDGSRVVIGAYFESPSSIVNAGSAYIFS